MLEERLALICKKLAFPYASMSSPEYFERPALLPQYEYNNDFHEKLCSDKEYKHMSDLVQYFQSCGLMRKGLGGQRDYHDLYLCDDILLYADSMESMRAEWRADCGLDMYCSMTLPSASLQALLYNTGAHIELITEANGGAKLLSLIEDDSKGIKWSCRAFSSRTRELTTLGCWSLFQQALWNNTLR